MSRDERLRIYSAAIVEGRTTLQHGWPLLRQTAIGAAAIDGLAELKPLIEAHYPEESAEVRSAFPLPELLVRLELGAGASDREDANRLASERLAAMKDADFRDRMNTDAAFQKVVGDIATYVCAVDTFAPRRNPGCASIKDIVKRQSSSTRKFARRAARRQPPRSRPCNAMRSELIHGSDAWRRLQLENRVSSDRISLVVHPAIAGYPCPVFRDPRWPRRKNANPPSGCAVCSRALCGPRPMIVDHCFSGHPVARVPCKRYLLCL